MQRCKQGLGVVLGHTLQYRKRNANVQMIEKSAMERKQTGSWRHISARPVQQGEMQMFKWLGSWPCSARRQDLASYLATPCVQKEKHKQSKKPAMQRKQTGSGHLTWPRPAKGSSGKATGSRKRCAPNSGAASASPLLSSLRPGCMPVSSP